MRLTARGEAARDRDRSWDCSRLVQGLSQDSIGDRGREERRRLL